MSGIFYVYISVAEVLESDEIFDLPENADMATKSAINDQFKDFYITHKDMTPPPKVEPCQ